MYLLVAGASGFIGRNFLLSTAANTPVIALYRSALDFPDFIRRNGLYHVTPVRVDLENESEISRVTQIARAFDQCVFLAANGDPKLSVNDPRYDLMSNTLTLVSLLRHVSIEKLVYFSSGAVYDGLKGGVSPATPVNPGLPYGISKVASERYVSFFCRAGTVGSAIIVRFFGAYGPFEPQRKIYSRLVRKFGIEKDPHITVYGDGRNLIDAMYVGDAVNAIMLMLAGDSPKGIVDLYSGQPVTIRQVVEEAARIFGLQPSISYEGGAPEYIEFFSIDESMKTLFAFRPTTSLKEGLLKLRATLLREQRQDDPKT
jgi:UDP-glucose 4-epimerase